MRIRTDAAAWPPHTPCVNPPAARSIHVEEPLGVHMDVHATTVEIHYHGAGAAELHALHTQNQHLKELIMATRAENAQAVADLAAQVRKAKQEIVNKIAALELAQQNSGNTTPEEDAAMTDLKTAVQGVDDVVPDAP